MKLVNVSVGIQKANFFHVCSNSSPKKWHFLITFYLWNCFFVAENKTKGKAKNKMMSLMTSGQRTSKLL